MTSNFKKSFVLSAVLVAMMIPSLASAAGFEYGPQGTHAVGRGGAFTVGADDATAIYWNPSRLALFDGTQILVNDNMSYLDMSFKRADARKRRVTQDPITKAVTYGEYYETQPEGYPYAFDSVSNGSKLFPLGASFMLVSDFGLKDWGFGIGLHGPTTVGKVTFGNAYDAANKYMFSGMDSLVLYLDFSAAWKFKEWFGLGVTMQYVMVPYLKYSMTMMGPAAYTSQNTPVNNSNDIQTDVNVTDWGSFSMLVGGWARPFAWYKPLKKFEIGFCARVVPIKIKATGDIDISGADESVYKNYKTKIPGQLSYTYPIHVQTGVRYAYEKENREIFDIELDYVWENWAGLDAFYMKTLGNFNGPGVTMNPMDITIPRNFIDSHSIRLGGQYNAIKDWLTVRVGGWWESGAMPDAYTNLDLPSWDRWGLGLGLSTNIYGFEIAFSYNHIFQESREVTDGKITQQVMYVKTNTDGTPVSDVRAGYVINNGSYSSSIDVFSLGLSYKFGPKAKKVEEDLPPIMPDTLPLPNPAPAEEGQEAPSGQSAVNQTVETTPQA